MSHPSWRLARSASVLTEISAYARPESPLTPSEQERHRRLRRRTDRDDFVAARALARLVLVGHLGTGAVSADLTAVRFSQVCETCGGPHGRPAVLSPQGFHVSWAHSHGVVAAAVHDEPVGVDVEHIGSEPPPQIEGEGVLPWLVWTRIEALVKLGVIDLDQGLAMAPELADEPFGEARIRTLRGHRVCWEDRIDRDLGVVATVATHDALRSVVGAR